MKQFLATKLGNLCLRCIQAILFAIPFAIFIFRNRESFFTVESKVGISGLVILGGLIWVLALAKVIGKMPKFLWFVIISALFILMDYLSGFLRQIGNVIIWGAILALPLNLLIEAKSIVGKTQLEEESRKKYYKKLNKKKIDVEIQ